MTQDVAKDKTPTLLEQLKDAEIKRQQRIDHLTNEYDRLKKEHGLAIKAVETELADLEKLAPRKPRTKKADKAK